ncbi:MAG: YitT family protein [Oscillospiraceae bacterium]
MFTPHGKTKFAYRDYLFILLGAALLAFGMYNVHSQSNVTEGGVLGLVLLLHHWLNIPASVSTFILDATCYLLGYKFLGKKFLKYSIVGTVSVSVFFAILEQFPPLLPSFENHPLVAAVLGGLFVGVGVGLIVRVGAASGGDDALAMVLSKKLKWPISRAYLFTDLAVLLLSLTYISIGRIIFSLITVTISSFLIGRIECFGKPKAPAKKPVAQKANGPTV